MPWLREQQVFALGAGEAAQPTPSTTTTAIDNSSCLVADRRHDENESAKNVAGWLTSFLTSHEKNTVSDETLLAIGQLGDALNSFLCHASRSKSVASTDSTGDGLPLPQATETIAFWRLKASPTIWDVPRQMLVSSRLGRWLEQSGRMDTVVVFCSCLTAIMYLLQARVGDIVQVQWENDKNEVVILDFFRPNPVVGLSYNAAIIFSMVLILHRANRQLFSHALLSFEGIAICVSGTTSTLIVSYNRFRLLSLAGHLDTHEKVLDAISTVVACVFFIFFVPVVDCLRFVRKGTLCILACLFVASGYKWFAYRCLSKEFIAEPNCTTQLSFNFREICSGNNFQVFLFVGKGIFARLAGNTFGCIHPEYVTASMASQRSGASMKSSIPWPILEGSQVVPQSMSSENTISSDCGTPDAPVPSGFSTQSREPDAHVFDLC